MPPDRWASQRPTIVDVAALSGVSKSTVSNVLRGAGRVSESTRARVLESMEALGYRPNSLARDLVRRRSRTLGVVLGDLANTFYADLVKLLELRISDAAYTTIVCNTDGRGELERARVEMLLERAVSACRADPTAGDWFDLPGLLDELAEVYQQLGRVDDALAAMRAAIDAGYAGSPDPRCRLAEIMLRAGRTESAAQVYAQVSAGCEYAAAGDPQQALDWFTEGLQQGLPT